MKTIRGEEKVRAELVLCHINDKGTGSAVKFAVVPASCYETGGLKVTFAHQSGKAIDWKNTSIETLMEFEDVAKLLEVLRGETESINNNIGLRFERIAEGFSGHLSVPCKMYFKHILEPESGYRFNVHESGNGIDEGLNWTIILTNAEAMGLAIALENSMSAIAFGLWRW